MPSNVQKNIEFLERVNFDKKKNQQVFLSFLLAPQRLNTRVATEQKRRVTFFNFSLQLFYYNPLFVRFPMILFQDTKRLWYWLPLARWLPVPALQAVRFLCFLSSVSFLFSYTVYNVHVHNRNDPNAWNPPHLSRIDAMPIRNLRFANQILPAAGFLYVTHYYLKGKAWYTYVIRKFARAAIITIT